MNPGGNSYSGYRSAETWANRRPNVPPGHTVPLGVRGTQTEDPAYSYAWFYNAQRPDGSRYYDPPDRTMHPFQIVPRHIRSRGWGQ